MALRILHIITRLDLGGSAENTLLSAAGLARKGHHVAIVAGFSENPPSSGELAAQQAGVEIRRTRLLRREVSPLADLACLWRLCGIIRSGRYDIVHTHTSKAGVIGRLAGRLCGVKTLVHTPHGHIFYAYFSPGMTTLFMWLERLVAPLTHAHIALTSAEREEYLERGIGSPGNFHQVFSGIILEKSMVGESLRLPVREGLAIPPTAFVSLTIARLVPVKNHDLIVRAAVELTGRFPDIYFVFAGDGELRGKLEALAEREGVSARISFVGWRQDIPALLAASDIFVLCSHNEGMGRVFVEAQAAGLPCVGSNVCGIPEVVCEGKTGYLVPTDDPHQLAVRIESLYSRRHTLEPMRDACRKWACSKFSVETMVDKIELIYMGAAPEIRRADAGGEMPGKAS